MQSRDTPATPFPETPATTLLEGGRDEQHKPVGFDVPGDGQAEQAPQGSQPPKRSVFKPVGFDRGGDGQETNDDD